ncbi:MAG: hypothetical protein HXX11_19030 [Desulfuromonadales bacterium]|nr:hypothetical protein [Desulfuromonadales bacterium]
MDIDDEVSVKDIVNFHIKINNASKAKKALVRLSSKDKVAAFTIIENSAAHRDFKIEVAKYFIYDLDPRVRRKAEVILETLVPGWVSDPGESILSLLKSAGGKGVNKRNAAVKFLFGVIDANSLRDTFLTLLNSRNRAHMVEIIDILEEYIDSSGDEAEQVKIFDGCLDIVLSDDAEQSVKHHACNLLSVFFKKVATTQLGEILRIKYIERQVEKADSIHRYLCSGAAGLNSYFLDDLLRPLNEGGKTYQLKMVTYFLFVLEKIKDPAQVDTILDTYPDYWSKNEPPKEEKVNAIFRRIKQALEELWESTEDRDVRELIIRIKYDEYVNKRDLLEQIRVRLEDESLVDASRQKVSMMLRCYLHPDEDDALKLQVAHLLMFKLCDPDSRAAALEYLKTYAENRNLNSAEKGSVAAVMELLLGEAGLPDDLRNLARYVLFVAAPDRIAGLEEQSALLEYLRGIIDGRGLDTEKAEELAQRSLEVLLTMSASDELHNVAQYLVFKIKKRPAGVTAKPV